MIDKKAAFALFGGIGGLTMLIGMVSLLTAIYSMLEQQHYQMGHCTITAKKLLTSTSTDNSSEYGPRVNVSYAPHFDFTVYTADGRHYTASGYDGSNTSTSEKESQQAIVDSYILRQSYPCWYNPSNPTEAVLVRRPNWFLFIFSAIVLWVGGVLEILGIFMLLGRITLTTDGLAHFHFHNESGFRQHNERPHIT